MASTPYDEEGSETLDLKKAQFANVWADIDRVRRNMALADSPQQLRAMQKVFDETTATAAKLEAEIELLRTVQTRRASESDVDAATALAIRLTGFAHESSLKAAGEAIRLADVKLYFRFERVQEGKRLLNKVAGGNDRIG